MLDHIHEAQWSQLSELIAGRMGLYYSPERKEELQRSFAGAVQEFGFDNASSCVDWLLTTPPTKAQLQVLATYLTIGETYFFRDRQSLDALESHLLPELIRARRGREQRLHFWSAACCSGEEAYSLAILLYQALPDLCEWQVTITATDINNDFLRKAEAGIYGEWSFRNVPPWLKQRYFKHTADGRHAIIPEIKKLVTFSQLNLVEDDFAAAKIDGSPVDVIFCRNVLMYFSPSQACKVIGKLSRGLGDDGWLAVAPSEASTAMFPQFHPVNFPGAILFQKKNAASRVKSKKTAFAPEAKADFLVAEDFLTDTPPVAVAEVAEAVSLKEQFAIAEPSSTTPLSLAESLYQQGSYQEAADALLAAHAEHKPEPAVFSLMARTLANQGKLAEALEWCNHWIAADKLDAKSHYLRAVILLEQGDIGQAQASLQRAIYLNPDFVLAHFSLGNLAHGRGKRDEASRHFANTLRLLRGLQPNDLLPESDCLTAGRLIEIITSM